METLIITGACGVGKSTVAREWAKAKGGAVVECDYFTEWVYKSDFPHWTTEEERFVASLTTVVSREYLRYPMPVAIENVWSPLGIRLLVDTIRPYEWVTSLKAIYLLCAIDENHRRDQSRISENQMKGRVDIVNEELKSYAWPEYVQIIDSTNLSVEETTSEIERCHPVPLPTPR